MIDLREAARPTRRLDVAALVEDAVTAWTVVGDERARLGERPLWDTAGERLVWVDIDGRRVLSRSGEDLALGAASTVSVPSTVSLAWPTASGGLLLATGDGLGVHDGTALGPLTRPAGMPGRFRFNDGACDPSGRLWVASMAAEGAVRDGTVYRADGGARGTKLHVEPVVAHVDCGNGIGWSPDGTVMYLVESVGRVVYRLPYDVASGTAGAPQPFLAFDREGPLPDGLTVDADGGLWIAVWDGGHVLRFAPDGTPVAAYAIPTPQVTCLGFGRPGAREAFVSTAGGSTGHDAGEGRARTQADPFAGALFRLPVDVDGLPTTPFADA